MPQPTGDAVAAAEEGTTSTGKVVVMADRPNHVWHVDLTTVPIFSGFWVPWLPNALPQYWPFCWWMVVVVDHISRRAVGFYVSRRPPTTRAVQAFLASYDPRGGRDPQILDFRQRRSILVRQLQGLVPIPWNRSPLRRNSGHRGLFQQGDSFPQAFRACGASFGERPCAASNPNILK